VEDVLVAINQPTQNHHKESDNEIQGTWRDIQAMRENLSEKSDNELQGTQLDIQVMKLVVEARRRELKAQLAKI
jgi:predicted transcriptional regulator YdeE